MNSDGFTLGADTKLMLIEDLPLTLMFLGIGKLETGRFIKYRRRYKSTVSAVNTTAGFSIVKYTGNGSASNIGHGLGAAPQCIISKKYSGY